MIWKFQATPNSIHVSNTRFTLVMNEAKAHIALHVSEFYILLCIFVVCVCECEHAHVCVSCLIEWLAK